MVLRPPTDAHSGLFLIHLVLVFLSSWGEAGDGPLFCQAQQTGEGPFGFWSSPRAEFEVCGSSGWFGGFRAQQQGGRFHQERRAAPVAGLHHRPQQPHGAQPPGQPLLLQKGSIAIVRTKKQVSTSVIQLFTPACCVPTVRITVKCSIWPSMLSITRRSKPCRRRVATS